MISALRHSALVCLLLASVATRAEARPMLATVGEPFPLGPYAGIVWEANFVFDAPPGIPGEVFGWQHP